METQQSESGDTENSAASARPAHLAQPGGSANGGKQSASKRKGPRPRRIPQRTCIACQQERPKRELIRVVRTPDGHVLLDPTSKKSGRGAYLCAKRSCWELALKKGKIEHALGVPISPEDRVALDEYVASLPPTPPEAATAAKATRARQSKKPATGVAP